MSITLESRLWKLTSELTPEPLLDNYDHYRFGPAKSESPAKTKPIARWLHARGWTHRSFHQGLQEKIQQHLGEHLPALSSAYSVFTDEESRDLFARVLLYRALGNARVRLPLSAQNYWKQISRWEQLVDSSTAPINPNFLHFSLPLLDLEPVGFPIRMFGFPKSAYHQLSLHQYGCQTEAGLYAVDEGDSVFDFGACYGDTALMFANRVGPSGKCYSFEFIPSSLDIFKRNRELNPELTERIQVMPNPVWDTPGLTVHHDDRGPATQVSPDPFDGATGTKETISIDQLAESGTVPSFIKMDIEGAELPALRGGEQTIRKHRPLLAITNYHSLDQFHGIPKWIADLDVGYRLFFRHFTIHAEESVVFAVPPDREICQS